MRKSPLDGKFLSTLDGWGERGRNRGRQKHGIGTEATAAAAAGEPSPGKGGSKPKNTQSPRRREGQREIIKVAGSLESGVWMNIT